jgi:hypothetical protein
MLSENDEYNEEVSVFNPDGNSVMFHHTNSRAADPILALKLNRTHLLVVYAIHIDVYLLPKQLLRKFPRLSKGSIAKH